MSEMDAVLQQMKEMTDAVVASRSDPATFDFETVKDAFQEEIDKLDEAHRLVVVLCDIEGLSYKETADVAQVPVGTVRSRLSRCRAHLRQRMQERMTQRDEEGEEPEEGPDGTPTGARS